MLKPSRVHSPVMRNVDFSAPQPHKVPRESGSRVTGESWSNARHLGHWNKMSDGDPFDLTNPAHPYASSCDSLHPLFHPWPRRLCDLHLSRARHCFRVGAGVRVPATPKIDHILLEVSNPTSTCRVSGARRRDPGVVAIISAVEICRQLQIRSRDYLGAILPGLANFSAKRVAELTTRAWGTRI
jgi:hypothetical protein